MLSVAVRAARATGAITKLNLRVRSDNTRAIHLYERQGFVREGRLSGELFIAGHYYSQDCMGLEL
jgi:RimJ/RimL family protein N-acetyltransferase